MLPMRIRMAIDSVIKYIDKPCPTKDFRIAQRTLIETLHSFRKIAPKY